MIYGEFAAVYDRLMDDYDYDTWAKHYVDLLPVMPRQAQTLRVTECACGTGNLTVRLAEAGYHMTGVDASLSMLRLAEEKAREAGVEAAFSRQDMRRFTVGQAQDAVLCTCDGPNYLTDLADVIAFFKASYRALRPGGWLIFDCSSRYKLETVIGNAFLGEEREGLAVLWQNCLDAATHCLRMDVTCFVRESDGRYRRFREEHKQRAHSQEEIFAGLQQAGFCRAEVFGDMTMAPPMETAQRLHWRAQKPMTGLEDGQ